jgi:hypothetical protein
VGFAIGAGLAGIGWAAAGTLLYPEARLVNQLFLVFILAGMMLGAASTLAARPEAYLPFIIPAGLPNAIWVTSAFLRSLTRRRICFNGHR